MPNVKLSQIASGGALNASTDTGVAVRSGTTDVLVSFAAVAASGSASDLSSGTLPAARLPNPSATTLGGVESIAAVSHNFLTSISTSGVPSQAQPTAADISGLGTAATENLSSVITDDGAGNLTIGAGTVTNAMLAGSIGAGKISLTNADIIVGNGSNVGAAVAMSGDATLANTGAITFATVNTNTGSFGSSTSIPNFTVNGKGLITAAGSNVVIAPAGTLSGTTLNSTVVTSSLTTVGTIGTGTWQGTKIGDAYGGTNADSSSATGVAQVSSGTWSWSTALANGTTATTQAALDNSTKVSTTAYTDAAVATAVAGINPAVAVQAATTTSANTSGLTYNNGVSGVGATFTGATNTAITWDGFTFTALGQRGLVKNDTQSPSGAFNGIYYVTQLQTALLPPILTRALDYDQPSDINNTGAIPVINGTINAATTWVQTAQIVTVGTTPLVYVQFSYNPSSIVTTFSAGSTGFTPSSATSGAITLAGTLAVANGGTGVTSSTGTGSVVLSNSPTLVTPALGTIASGVGTALTALNASNLSSGTIPSARLGVTSRPFAMPTVANTTGNNIALDAYASFGYTINEIDGIATSSGTCTVAIQINGTNVTGLSAISVTSTPQNVTATGANTVSATNRVSVIITSNSSGANLEFTMKATRT